eukprot:CAMPEP_0198109514 /NCGR_PEP_ID=MMETSP1442-20131203/1568_1 /TAXON_ID= /ORGANISM="Craspedostauros australis, Strain CCMP3328" /LENGTH=115 /DNA_ID=CAMNT_0043765213 /DNA_START=104 /DNA_END=451 /DNA_ORIENTATION=-
MGSASLNIAIAICKLSGPRAKSSSLSKPRSLLSKITRRNATATGDDHDAASQQTSSMGECSFSSLDAESTQACRRHDGHVDYETQMQSYMQVLDDMEQISHDMQDRFNGKDLILS